MGMFRRRVPNHYIPIHPDNVGKNDWIIVLEAGTIVGPSPDKLRVAVATLERKIVKKSISCSEPNTISSWTATIRAFTHCISVHNFTNLTPTELWSLWKAKKSASCSQSSLRVRWRRNSPGTTRLRNHQTSGSFPLHPWQTWTASSSIPQPGNHYSSRSRVPPRRMRASSQRLKVRRSLQRRQSDPARRLLGQQSIPRMTNQAHHRPALARDHREAELA